MSNQKPVTRCKKQKTEDKRPLQKKGIGIIGGGNMGEALLSGILKNRLAPRNRISVSEALPSRRKALKKRYGIFVTGCSCELAERSRIIVLAVKPQQMTEVLEAIGALRENTLVISIAAGIRLSFLTRYLGKLPIIRVMPNLPAAVGRGISAMAKNRFTAKRHCTVAERLFQSVGETCWVSEARLDAVTAVSGSGPAYVAFWMAALARGAQSLGLPAALSRRLLQKTFEGSTAYLLEKGISPDLFIQKVASKGGTTEAALRVFRTRRVSQTVKEALRRAVSRARQLSKE
ncbi:MAG: pyrroline-5-carboxylate reductase [Candidatus Omnitrophota bacterium]